MYTHVIFKIDNQPSLMVQWLTICFAMRGTPVRSLVRKDPACRGAARPVPHTTEPVLPNKTNLHCEKPAHGHRSRPKSRWRKEAHGQHRSPSTARNKTESQRQPVRTYHNTGNCPVFGNNLSGRRTWKVDTGLCISGALCSTPESNTTLSINRPSIKKIKHLKIKGSPPLHSIWCNDLYAKTV